MTQATEVHPDELRRRIERLYEAAGAPTNDQGQRRPISWAAEQLGLRRQTVSRWLMDPDASQSREPGRDKLRSIELLEQQYDT